jgi:hypothetical protein
MYVCTHHTQKEKQHNSETNAAHPPARPLTPHYSLVPNAHAHTHSFAPTTPRRRKQAKTQLRTETKRIIFAHLRERSSGRSRSSNFHLASPHSDENNSCYPPPHHLPPISISPSRPCFYTVFFILGETLYGVFRPEEGCTQSSSS